MDMRIDDLNVGTRGHHYNATLELSANTAADGDVISGIAYLFDVLKERGYEGCRLVVTDVGEKDSEEGISRIRFEIQRYAVTPAKDIIDLRTVKGLTHLRST